MAGSNATKSNHLKFLRAAVPIITWLPRYKRDWLRADLLAGLAVWAMMVPQALAYAGLAGVPPVYGLYAVPLAMLAYAVFGTSRTLCVGPESAIAIISAVTVGALAAKDAGEFLALTSLLALVVGALFLVFGLLRLGWIANFLSQPVLQGFTQGIALTVSVSQIPKIFGTNAQFAEMVNKLSETWHTGFFLEVWAVIATLPQASIPTASIGLGALLLLFGLKRFKPGAPAALIAVIASVIAVSTFGLTDHGVDVIGEIETGMVSLSIPDVNLAVVASLMPGALAIVLLGYSVSLSVAAVGADTTGETIDPNQELVGLGVANLGAAVSSGFVVCGSLSRGVVIRRAGGQTQVVSLINAALLFLTLLFVLPLFFKLPSATLSAVVIQAMCGLLSYAYFRRLVRIDRGEFAYAMAALFGVLMLGILQGVALGVALSLAVLIRRVSRPATAELGRVPRTDNYRDVLACPDAETVPGLILFRFDAPIIFPNAGFFGDEVRRLMARAATPIREVLLSAHQINHLDSTGADKLAKLHAELTANGIAFSIAEAKAHLRSMMRRTDLEERIGADYFYESIQDGVQAFLERQEQASGEQV